MIPKFLRNMLGGSEDSAVEFDDIDRPSNATPQAETPATIPSDNELPTELLDAILGVINAQLPPIAAECINPEAQRRYLAGLLGQPLADFAESARRKAVSELTGDRAKMQSEIESLRAERKEVAGKREEQKAALLSEQRQRRALSDRNRDLEAKIDQLDSEIEQYKLTVSSLMNKMRVAEVTDGDSTAMLSEIEKLNEELKTIKETLAEKEAELTAQAEKIAELESASAVDAALEQRREAIGNTDAEPATQPKKRRSRQRKHTPTYDPNNDASADIDSVDWLLPGGVPTGHVGHVADPDFGYQPPKQAPEPDPDAQLTLF